MEAFIISILIVAAIIFMLIELFLIPGTSFAGIIAFGCFIYATIYAFVNLGVVWGVVTLIISLLLCGGAIAWFMKSKTLDKLALKENITSKINKGVDKGINVGDTGICITRLAQIGNAEINGKIIEVKTIEGLLDEKTPIVVTRIDDKTIFVERQKQ